MRLEARGVLGRVLRLRPGADPDERLPAPCRLVPFERLAVVLPRVVHLVEHTRLAGLRGDVFGTRALLVDEAEIGRMPLHRGESRLDRRDAVVAEVGGVGVQLLEVRADVDILDFGPCHLLGDVLLRQLGGDPARRALERLVVEHDAHAVLGLAAVALKRRTVLPAPFEGLERVVGTLQLAAAAMDVAEVQKAGTRPRERGKRKTCGHQTDFHCFHFHSLRLLSSVLPVPTRCA